MLFLARFALKGLNQTALAAAATAILGVMFTPALWLSAAVVALVTLVRGQQQGLYAMLLSLLGASLFAWLIFASPQVSMVFVLMAWLPAWLVAMVLQRSVSLALSLQVLLLLSLAATLLMFMLWPDLGESWREPLGQMATQLAAQSDEISLADLQRSIELLIGFMPALLALSVMMGSLISLFIARWWQAALYNPGGFGREFRSLDLGRASALIAIILLIASSGGSLMMLGLSTVVLVLYSVQALSLLHAAIKIRQINGGWLFFAYILVFFIPQVMLLLILLALLDPWLDFRSRLATKMPDNE